MQATFRSVTRNTYAYDDKTTTETGRHNTTRHKTKGTTRQYKAIQRRVDTACLMIYINEEITD